MPPTEIREMLLRLPPRVVVHPEQVELHRNLEQRAAVLHDEVASVRTDIDAASPNATPIPTHVITIPARLRRAEIDMAPVDGEPQPSRTEPALLRLIARARPRLRWRGGLSVRVVLTRLGPIARPSPRLPGAGRSQQRGHRQSAHLTPCARLVLSASARYSVGVPGRCFRSGPLIIGSFRTNPEGGGMLTPMAAPDWGPNNVVESAMWPRWLRADPRMPDGTALISRRIVVAEDNCLIVEDVAATLRAEGAEVVACSSLPALIDLIRSDQVIDVALLDLMLGDQLVYPAADALMARNVPIVFFSGHDRGELPERFAACLFLSKPVSPKDLVLTLI